MQLAETALHHRELAVAERCYAALGDVSKARFMHKVHWSSRKMWLNFQTKLGSLPPDFSLD